ncbi:MAG: hypothetical protein ACLPID_06120 [Beijerinckiaceae bacterium]
MTLAYVLGSIALIGYYAYLVLSFRPDLKKLVLGFLARIGALLTRRSRLHETEWPPSRRAS